MHSYSRPSWIQYALGLYFVAFGGLVRAQGSVEQCTSSLTPAPCPLLQALLSTCAAADGQDFVPLLNVTSEPLGQYHGPETNTTTLQQCQCTDVGYNLYAACAACQVGDDSSHWSSRDTWFSGCTANSSDTQIAVAPARMAPENISPWMTQIYNPTFSPSEALSVMNSPPLPISPISTITGSPGSGIISSGSTTNNTAIIVGIVVGAFTLLAIIALGILFCIIRRRRRRERRSRRGPIIL